MVKQFNEYEPLPGYHINGKGLIGRISPTLAVSCWVSTHSRKPNNTRRAKRSPASRPCSVFPWLFPGLAESPERRTTARLFTDIAFARQVPGERAFVDVDEFYTTFGIKPGDKDVPGRQFAGTYLVKWTKVSVAESFKTLKGYLSFSTLHNNFNALNL